MNDVGNRGDHILMWHIWKEDNDRWMEENRSLYLDFNSQNEFMTETIEQLSDLIIPLLRYQKEWLAWALMQEESIARGGILDDDMEMGKIVQAIALTLANREIGQAILYSSFLSPALYILPALKGTLVIYLVFAVIQWVNEIDRFNTKGSNTILVYHGANREKNIDSFLTDCTFVAQAHCVKNICSSTTRAILALESSYKWALSGTPLQNLVGELYSLNMALVIQFQGNHGFGRDAMILLKHKILKTIMLRRTKKGRVADLGLPPRIVTLGKDCFDVKEEDYYISLWDESRAQLNTYIQAGTLMNNYTNIFNLLTRMRQAVDHPYLVGYSSCALVISGRTTNVGYVEQPCCLCQNPVEDKIASCLLSHFPKKRNRKYKINE
ncbi:hypothetical protein RDI58_013594 [Solanum bulbocastanum]|uniref:SNF2 N-terminal domain-containing protein n=1 Tax=Solanum bulbocastanum TaxID=147425 RepID=A0AAN8TLD2_SOLBU